MSGAEQLEYVCVRCGRRESTTDALVSTCPQCGGEMHNLRTIDD